MKALAKYLAQNSDDDQPMSDAAKAALIGAGTTGVLGAGFSIKHELAT